MPIKSLNILHVKSSKLTDRDDAGGMATKNQILSGVSNQIMPDLSPLNRAAGSMFMRKIFTHIDSSDTDSFLGAHTVFTQIPKDKRLSVFMFNSKDYHDIRIEASNKFAAYRNRATRHQGTLWGTQWVDSKTITLFQATDAPIPKNNEVYEIVDKTNPSTKQQFIRLVDVVHTVRSFTIDGRAFKKRIVDMTISQKLKQTYVGSEMSKDDAQPAQSSIYATRIADSSRIYTSKHLTKDIVPNELTCQVDTPFVQAVPASAGFKGLLNQKAYTPRILGGSVSTVLPKTDVGFVNLKVGSVFQITPFEPTSFRLSGGFGVVTSNGNTLLHNGAVCGTCNPYTGLLSITKEVGNSHNCELTYKQMSVIDRVGTSFSKEITSANVSSTYVHQFPKDIIIGSVVCTYISMGEKYTLTDNGAGGFDGDGSGSIDYTGRSCAVNLNSLVDEGSYILFNYSAEVATHTNKNVTGLQMHTEIAANSKSLRADSISVSWSVNNSTKTATLADQTHAKITLRRDAILVTFAELPPVGTELTTTYEYNESKIDLLDKVDANYNTTTNKWHGNSQAPNGKFVVGSVVLTLHLTPNLDTWSGGWHGASTITYDKNEQALRYVDNGLGELLLRGTTIKAGTVDYDGGTFELTPKSKRWIYAWDNASNQYKRAAIGDTILDGGSSLEVRSSLADADKTETQTTQLAQLNVSVESLAFAGILAPCGVAFTLNNKTYTANDTKIYLVEDIMKSAGAVGSINVTTSELAITKWGTGLNALTDVFATFIGSNTQLEKTMAWYVDSAPIQNGSIQGEVRLRNGTVAKFQADTTGVVTSSNSSVTGVVNAQLGFVALSSLNDEYFDVGSMTYNVTTQEILPVDGDIIKMDTVRLPIDGRVTAYRRGDLLVAMHDKTTTSNVSNGDVITLRDETSYVRITDTTGAVIPDAAFTLNLVTHEITWNDITGIAMPVTIVDRVEELRILSNVNNLGELTVRDPFTFAFPKDETMIASAMVHTDLFASVTRPFDQKTWLNHWLDVAEGELSLGQYNDTVNPIVVTNKGCIDDRILIKFRSPTLVDVISEHLGLLLANANVNSVIAPNNPIQDEPFFIIPAGALNVGFSGGNALRFNTVSADAPIWVMEAVSFGEPTDTSPEAHKFCIESRGAVNI